jgi:predicted Zn-dependent protease
MKLSQDTMLPKLKQALEEVKTKYPDQFYAWKIVIENKKSLQTLMVGKELSPFDKYQSRDVLDHSYKIDVYSRHSDPMVMGNAGFTIDPLGDLNAQVENTYSNSLMVSNKPWDLSEKVNGEYETVLTNDPQIAENITSAHERLLLEIDDKVKTLDKVKVNSGELFTNLKTTYFEMSTGLSGQKENSDIYFEMALEKLPLPNTQEVLKYKNAISIEDADLSRFIDKIVDETLSIKETQLPKTNSNATIMIDGEAIGDLMEEFVNQLSAGREYDKAPFLTNGDSVFKGDKSSSSGKLNITLDPTVPVMAMSTPFTSEGMKPIKASVISDDTVVTQLINGRIGQYLGKEPNYIDGNVVVEVGTKSKEEILQSVDSKECIEILTFSSLLINSNTLTWSSEIKLGKLWENGKVTAMIKGGVVSGDIKENLSNFQFSNETIKKNHTGGGFYPPSGYVGPNHMLIESGVKIAGE